MSFTSLGLSAPILKAVAEQGYDTPSPIQAQAIPAVLQGKDVMAAAQTGTGKTAGFTLPMLELLSKGQRAQAGQVRALVLTPTRELAAQIAESVETYGKYLPLRSAVIFGGVPINPQIAKLRHGVDVLVATPGRLMDLYNQKAVKFNQLEILVLDEADRMLDMGFIRDIRKILAILPKQRQNLMFSATFSDEIRELAKGLVNDPVEISVTPRNAAATTVKQWVCPVAQSQKAALLTQLIKQNDWQQVLVFSRTKHGANRLAKNLEESGIKAAAIHGNKSQTARTKALADFKNGQARVLVATDIAARGLDIDQLPQVVNFDLPNVPEDYVHRIGRTGRAGASGQAVSLVSSDEIKLLNDIERLINRVLDREMVEGFHHDLPESRLSGGGKSSGKSVPSRRNTRSSNQPSSRDGAPRSVEHKDGQRSGDVARGHKPNDKNPRHSAEASNAPRSDAKPRPPRANDSRANSAGANRPSENPSGAGENRGQAGENPYANGPKKNTRRPNNGASRPRNSQD
ncbi:MAG: DEAD/DEAH box helicase [Shewanella sp.]